MPTTATATIQPVNLFGAEQVAISTPGDNSDAGPYLAPDASFARAQSSDELGDLFAAATPLLNNPGDSVIIVQSTYSYSSAISFVLQPSFTLTHLSYSRPRPNATGS